jgi:hypothetical protein
MHLITRDNFFTVAALPICLLENSNVPLVGRRASLVGWGKISGQEGMDVFPSEAKLKLGQESLYNSAMLIRNSLFITFCCSTKIMYMYSIN